MNVPTLILILSLPNLRMVELDVEFDIDEI